ncbi:MAG: hypothetical protein P4L50_21970 [Anaerolineaceae bacterium]|nr:hypothetical protein [Anaerolineaceae bacterium]
MKKNSYHPRLFYKPGNTIGKRSLRFTFTGGSADCRNNGFDLSNFLPVSVCRQIGERSYPIITYPDNKAGIANFERLPDGAARIILIIRGDQ